MTTKKPAAAKPAGLTIANCSFTAEAGRVSPEAAAALAELARASAENARAITAIAEALKGSPGRMDTAIRIDNPSTY
ncbi:MAG: hypothetical protein ACOVN4_04400 [Bosea sp. (in: a-proteobacteria)]|jgi:hypothetical protein